MIVGIGTDIMSVARMRQVYARFGERLVQRLLTVEEGAECQQVSDKARFLAKRFAAKEALSKALGTGLCAPVTLHNMRITHDEIGKPLFACVSGLEDYVREKQLVLHLSISDEREFAVAFVIVERKN